MLVTPQAEVQRRCWICGSARLIPVKASDVAGRQLSPEDFAITDRRYGVTAAIDRCGECGFLQCTDADEVLGFYSDLNDKAYDEGRSQRALQARRLVETIRRFAPGGTLLDIGAGSGILVEEATLGGFRAEGIEPSARLAEAATRRGLAVHRGTLPHPSVSDKRYDVVSLVDVIEHVPDPVDLLRQAAAVMAPGGVGIVVTPDVRSVMARIMGRRWWHYRIAHIGYFSRATLTLALRQAGLRVVAFGRPRWYFNGDYLGERLVSYFPAPISRMKFAWAKSITIPLDLRDSMYMVFARTERPKQ